MSDECEHEWTKYGIKGEELRCRSCTKRMHRKKTFVNEVLYLQAERDELKAKLEELQKKADECICCIPMA